MATKAVLRKGESKNFSFDWSRVCKKLGVTLSSSTWSIESGNATVGSATTSGFLSTATFTNASSRGGCATAKNTATLSDGQIHVRKLIITLEDETCVGGSDSDYGMGYL